MKRLAPQPDTQRTEWRLNGRVVATGTDEVELAFGGLAEYEVTFSLTDESPFIRPDPPHARYPYAEVRWRITNAKPTSRAKPLPVAVESRDPEVDATVVQAPMAPREPSFAVGSLRFEKAEPTSIRIANAEDGYRYLWYTDNLPSHLPRFPHGIYVGAFAVADEIHKGAVYVNGAKVDPFTTPMPTGFYVVTYELSQRIDRGFRTTEGHYEGAVAECLVYDGKLTQAEREGVEAYLRGKWLSAVHLASRPDGRSQD